MKDLPVVAYHFQLSPYHDFRTLRYENDAVVDPWVDPELLLGVDSVYYWRVSRDDGFGWSEFSDPFAAFIGPGCCVGFADDVDLSGAINVSDLTYLVARLFQGGPPPPCRGETDVDGSGLLNVSDLTYLVAYLFQGGPDPKPCR